jgi:RNA polymerase sigma-54 factor
MEIGQQLLPQLQLKVTPKQIAANYILQLSSLQLQEVISQELAENPALEQTETAACPLCGTPLTGRVCTNCFGTPSSNVTHYDDDTQPLEGTSLLGRDEEDDEYDPIVRAEAEQTLSEYLLWNLRATLPRSHHSVAEYLVGSLNENGYLDISMDEVLAATGAERRTAEQTLRALQSIEPIGIGARDTRECLLLQLDHLAEQGIVHPNARAIVSDHFRELGEHKFGEIAQAFRISREEVQEAWDFIKTNLNPFPAHGWAIGPEGVVGEREVSLRPDVLIRRTETGDYEVEVIESRRFMLRVNPVYRDLVRQIHAARGSGGNGSTGPQLDDKARHHVREYVTRAKFFIDNINQRRQTISRITETIVECQRDFLDQGVQHLRPLTRAEVAERIGMHESTVSRATAGKFAMLPDGKVVPFSMFFTASLGVKDVIRNLIGEEDPRRPYSDREIVEKLKQEGIILARRTVAKYREEMKILPARLRKRA